MKILDFEYNGHTLKDMGFMICNFGSSGISTSSNGSQITFNKIPEFNGEKFNLTSTQYNDCLTSTFQICKRICSNDGIKNSYDISIEEIRKISKWLNRKQFVRTKLINNENINMYVESSFNINKIDMGDKTVGLELNMETNSPFIFAEEKTINISNPKDNGTFTIDDTSDEEGFIYPEMDIKVNKNGNLTISNSIENRIMEIKNCKVGEIIHLEYPIISTSLNSHNINNDFNWSFFRISNSSGNNRNILTMSIPCDIILKYSPIMKLGL